MEKQIKIFWIAGFFLPTINATVFRVLFDKESTYMLIQKSFVKRFGLGSRIQDMALWDELNIQLKFSFSEKASKICAILLMVLMFTK